VAGTDQLSAVFSALADPTRRAILAKLASDVRFDLELLDDRRLGNGVVYLRYRIPT
jgi:hypothetical protein